VYEIPNACLISGTFFSSLIIIHVQTKYTKIEKVDVSFYSKKNQDKNHESIKNQIEFLEAWNNQIYEKNTKKILLQEIEFLSCPLNLSSLWVCLFSNTLKLKKSFAFSRSECDIFFQSKWSLTNSIIVKLLNSIQLL